MIPFTAQIHDTASGAYILPDIDCMIIGHLEWEMGEPFAIIDEVRLFDYDLREYANVTDSKDILTAALVATIKQQAASDETVFKRLCEADNITLSSKGALDPEQCWKRS